MTKISTYSTALNLVLQLSNHHHRFTCLKDMQFVNLHSNQLNFDKSTLVKYNNVFFVYATCKLRWKVSLSKLQLFLAEIENQQ